MRTDPVTFAGGGERTTLTPGYVTIATAGHVDHGKSTLVRALTGIDPDRLPEERRRSMTIELGYAALPRPDGGIVALIDVPGHERLVETMIGGAGGIDAALLVVAADDGPMPQTREHLRILDVLGIRQIVVALTRTDLVDAEWASLAGAETASLLRERGFHDVPIVPVSCRTGSGIERLRSQLQSIPPRPARTTPGVAAWLPIDRVFTRPGIGTVVAGTLLAGRLATGDAVVVHPAGITTTIRQIESQGEAVVTASPGQRVAVNLAGLDRSAIARGDVLADRQIAVSAFADVSLRLADDAPASLTSGDTVRVLTGTARRNARVRLLGRQRLLPGQDGLAEIAFDRPLPIRVDDRLVMRRSSPPATLGGGVVLARHGSRPRGPGRARWPALQALALGDPVPELERRLARGPIALADLTADLPAVAGPLTRAWLADGTILPVHPSSPVPPPATGETLVISRHAWDAFIDRLTAALVEVQTTRPQSPGLPLTQVRTQTDVAAAALVGAALERGLIVQSGPYVHLPGYRPRLSPPSRRLADAWLADVADQPLGRATLTAGLDADEVAILVRDTELVRLRDDRVVTSGAFDRFGQSILVEIERAGHVDLATVRDTHALGRDSAQRLLECLDDCGATTRVGDRRVLGPRATDWRRAATDRATGQSSDPHS